MSVSALFASQICVFTCLSVIMEAAEYASLHFKDKFDMFLHRHWQNCVPGQQAFCENRLGLYAPVILFVCLKEWKKRRRRRERRNSLFLWAFSVPADQHSPKPNTGRQQQNRSFCFVLFWMEFQSKWPITEWNSNLATNSQSFSLSNDCTTKYHIITCWHTPAQSLCEWEHKLNFYFKRAKSINHHNEGESLNRSPVSFISSSFVPLKTNRFLNTLQNYKHDQSNIYTKTSIHLSSCCGSYNPHLYVK